MPLVHQDRAYVRDFLLGCLEDVIDTLVENSEENQDHWHDARVTQITTKISSGLQDFNHMIQSGEIYAHVLHVMREYHEIKQKDRFESSAPTEGEAETKEEG